MLTNEEEKLAAAVADRLEEAGLGPYGLKVRCRQGTVSLQGIVDVLTEKETAARVAEGTPGVVRVINDVTVCTDGAIDDGDVAVEVAEELAGTPDGGGIGAVVNGGRVKLMGRVGTAAAAAKAIQAASGARGVRSVDSALTIAPEAALDDPSLVNAVQAALSDLFGGSARRIEVAAKDGVVTLAGTAGGGKPSEIVRLVQGVPGVRRVIDRLHPSLEAHDRIIGAVRERLAANPFLDRAPLSFELRDGRLTAEGEIDGWEAKRDLDRILHEVWDEHRLELRGIDNRVRLCR